MSDVMKATPGPWTVRRAHGGGQYAHITSATRENIAAVTTDADAQLISAAPDLLEAARLAEDIWGPSFDASKDASGCSGWGPGEVDAINALRAAITRATPAN